MKVRVSYLQQSQDLWLEVVSGKGPNVMRCDLLENIKLNWAGLWKL